MLPLSTAASEGPSVMSISSSSTSLMRTRAAWARDRDMTSQLIMDREFTAMPA